MTYSTKNVAEKAWIDIGQHDMHRPLHSKTIFQTMWTVLENHKIVLASCDHRLTDYLPVANIWRWICHMNQPSSNTTTKLLLSGPTDTGGNSSYRGKLFGSMPTILDLNSHPSPAKLSKRAGNPVLSWGTSCCSNEEKSHQVPSLSGTLDGCALQRAVRIPVKD
jgi:hypothetical protein